MRGDRLRFDAAVAAAVVGLAIFVSAAIWGFWQRAQISQQICQAQVQDRAALRGSFRVAEQLSIASRPRTEAELNNVRHFWRELLESVPPLQCDRGKPIEGGRG